MDDVSDLDGLLDSAFEAVEAGRLEQAEGFCRKAIDLDPESFEAAVLLGIVAGETDRPDLAETMLRRAIAIAPDSAEAHRKLGGQLYRIGNIDEAIAILEKSIELEPEAASGYHDLGVILLEGGRIGDAMERFEQTVTCEPELAIAHYRLGHALELQGNDARAIECYRTACELDPMMVDALTRLGSLLYGTGQNEEAASVLKRAAELDPQSANGRLSAAKAMIEEGRIEEAERYLAETLATGPEIENLHQLRGNCLQQLGRFDEAIPCFERAIAIDPRQHLAYIDIVHSRKVTAEHRPLLDDMAVLLENPQLADRHRTRLCFGLGKAFDDLGDHEAAIGYFDLGNGLQRRFCYFDRDRVERFVDLSISGFSGDFIRRSAAHGNLSELPILIVGMPRSGTTLVEQILSSHPEVGGAGELIFWSGCAARLGQIPSDGLAPDMMSGFAEEYLQRLREAVPGKGRVSDKMPDNFYYLGLIHAVFPNARIIHCRRNPVDTALSIYFTQFANGHEYAYDRGDLVGMYRQYERLMAHWRRVLPPDRLIEVDYERVVEDRESTARALIDFCGLNWDDACLRHEDNNRVVKTASIWQARQPIYKTSVARWKRYEPWLGELRALHPGDR